MIETTVQEEILRDLRRLPVDLQHRAQALVHSLTLSGNVELPPGARAKDLMEVTGILDPDSAREMRDAIEAGCEQVDPDAW